MNATSFTLPNTTECQEGTTFEHVATMFYPRVTRMVLGSMVSASATNEVIQQLVRKRKPDEQPCTRTPSRRWTEQNSWWSWLFCSSRADLTVRTACCSLFMALPRQHIEYLISSPIAEKIWRRSVL